MTQLQEKNAVMAYKFGMPVAFLCKIYRTTYSEIIQLLHKELVKGN